MSPEARRHLRQVVLNYLDNRTLKRAELAELAEHYGISLRTLYEWRRGGGGGRPGRPKRVQVDPLQARAWIEPRWKVMAEGKNGVRPVRAKLAEDKRDVPVELVREIVRELKHERAQRERERREANRVSVRVLARDALWALDQMHLGRDEHGRITALQASDCATQRILGASVGPPACGVDVVRLLEQAAKERGVYPFVLQVDNGPENANALVRAWAALHGVILLFNLPHTPEHNPRGERTNGDLRQASGLYRPAKRGADPVEVPVCITEAGILSTRAACAVVLAEAWHALDVCTPRASLGNLTPCGLDRIASRAEDRACRARFYREVCEELERIARLACSARERRTLEREAIWCALQRYGLVERTRGGLPVLAIKSEGIT